MIFPFGKRTITLTHKNFALDNYSVLVNLKLKNEINELKQRKVELEEQIAIDKK